MRYVFKTGTLLLCLLSLSGCFHHNYRARPYSLSQTDLCENVQEAFDSPSLAAGEICYEAWWEFFQDSQLNRFIELSLACHPDIKIAEARVQRACQLARIARSTLFPHFFFGGDIERQKVSRFGSEFPGELGTFTEVTLELTSACYELDIWQKNRSLFYAALDEMQARVADFEEAKLILATTITAVYFDLQWKMAWAENTQERLVAREELYNLLQQQFEFGIISEYRLYETDTQVQLLKDQLSQLQGEIEIDKHALAALVGNVVCDGELELKPHAQYLEPFPLPCSLPCDLLARRPDVTARKWSVEANRFFVKYAKALFLPKLDLLGYFGTQSFKLSRLFTHETTIALADAMVTLPLFTAGKLQGELGFARESLEIAIEEYNQTLLNAVQQVSDALTDLMTADQRKQSLDASIEDARDLYFLTKQRFDNGIVNRIAVLNAIENVLLQKELGIQIELDRYGAVVELIKAIGGGYYDRDCQR